MDERLLLFPRWKQRLDAGRFHVNELLSKTPGFGSENKCFWPLITRIKGRENPDRAELKPASKPQKTRTP